MLAPSSTPRPATVQDLAGPELLGALDKLDILSRKVFAGKLPGERRSKKRGQSVEFDDYRSYVPGDDLRHIDWNVFARVDKFFIKIFREDEDLALHLVVDASPSMDAGEPSKLVFAQRLALALAYIGLVNQNRVVVSLIGAPGRAPVQRLNPLRGRRNVERVARFLLDKSRPPEEAERETGAGDSFNRALRAVAHSRSGRGVMVVISDFLVRADLREGLNFLACGGGYETTCLQVLAPTELDPARAGAGAIVGDLRLIDVETGDGAEVTISAAMLKRYRQRLERHVETLRLSCAARGMNHLLLRSDAEIGPLILGSLRRRELVG